ncbi:hypothetical protein BN874_80056 [Candidatus Contendobacter odensis Run_B_J11]|uniref:Uncharacterized protein n=1 Tax=Candidatus Contendobacter odensis Run_B_J11 TaxID=1400861 RepID=A0A7U7GFE7_9GAMM|nr:hypothetical protein BN874_80056 [Candidatus Contendobacter odensis Run_B_J11]
MIKKGIIELPLIAQSAGRIAINVIILFNATSSCNRATLFQFIDFNHFTFQANFCHVQRSGGQ